MPLSCDDLCHQTKQANDKLEWNQVKSFRQEQKNIFYHRSGFNFDFV